MFSGQHAERQGSKVARSLLSIVIMVLVVFGLSRLLNTFVFGAYEIPSGSMEDTIEVGDLIFSEKLSYYTSEPQKGGHRHVRRSACLQPHADQARHRDRRPDGRPAKR